MRALVLLFLAACAQTPIAPPIVLHTHPRPDAGHPYEYTFDDDPSSLHAR